MHIIAATNFTIAAALCLMVASLLSESVLTDTFLRKPNRWLLWCLNRF
ncbi:hypothetical protein Patl1_31182 [Pistacia atlantica]|uniref:Uncharacterized protein n=1 Tax=Pistacia atlantica TaxID=434234 RepID=A0ACC1AAL4_9ROSI|nr:hypothetical protein Patl1_31182 [Pistacia atlantica]